jgi:hypothetical protein
MTEHIEQPETDDVEGHFLPVDDEGRTAVPHSRRPAILDDDEDDMAGHVLDLDVERKR